MPQPGFRWRLITINTKYSWIHGSPRGFRDRKHRIHSSGDYRNPPPKGQHAGLYRYERARSKEKEKIRLTQSVREVVSQVLVETLKQDGYRVLAVSVSSDHAHLVVELPDEVRQIKRIIGDAKRRASRTIRKRYPGAVWSEGCDYEPIDDRARLEAEVEYVLEKQGNGSWTWSFRDGGMWCEERIARERGIKRKR